MRTRQDTQIAGESSDGVDAIDRAKELQPELILLDIGLPELNGIDAARNIRRVSPQSKILFVTQETSADIVQECISTGAHGFLVKTDAGSELMRAVDTVLCGEHFLG